MAFDQKVAVPALVALLTVLDGDLGQAKTLLKDLSIDELDKLEDACLELGLICHDLLQKDSVD